MTAAMPGCSHQEGTTRSAGATGHRRSASPPLSSILPAAPAPSTTVAVTAAPAPAPTSEPAPIIASTEPPSTEPTTEPPPPTEPPLTTPPPTATPTTQVAAGEPGEAAATVTVAQAVVSSVTVHDQPDGSSITTLANPIATGAPLVFLVVDQQPGWFHVDLPVRPNGSTGWVRASDVSTSQHNYRIDVELGQHRITVMRGASLVLQASIAVGTSDTPTPAHTFYIKELLKPTDGAGNYIPDGDYGPFAYGLSGFSEVLTDFNGGNGELGIHGTNHPELIGTNVSHGCIRMRNEDITMLAGILPLGVPVRIFP